MGVELAEPPRRRVDLGRADIGDAVEHLSLQVGERHRIWIDDPERANAGGGKIEGGRRAQAAGADDQNPGGLERLLARPADFAQDEVAGVAVDFGLGERHSP